MRFVPARGVLRLGAARAALKSSQESALPLSIQRRQVGSVLHHPKSEGSGCLVPRFWGQTPLWLQRGGLYASGQLRAGLSLLSNVMLAQDRHGIA